MTCIWREGFGGICVLGSIRSWNGQNDNMMNQSWYKHSCRYSSLLRLCLLSIYMPSLYEHMCDPVPIFSIPNSMLSVLIW